MLQFLYILSPNRLPVIAETLPDRELAGKTERAFLLNFEKTSLALPRHKKPRNKKEGNNILLSYH